MSRAMVAAVLVVVLGSCSPAPTASPPTLPSASPGASPGASGSPAATALPSPVLSPSATDSADPDGGDDEVPTPTPDPCGYAPFDGPWTVAPLLPGSAVRVSVSELNVRQGPCVAARKLTTVKKGGVLIVPTQPVPPIAAAGYAWYTILFPPNAPNGALPPLPEQWFPDGTDTDGGWIAAAQGSRAYVTPLAARCPKTIDLENLTAMLPAEWLACFDTPIVVEGTFGCGGCGGSGGPIGSPSWLADTFEFDQIRVRFGDEFEFRPVGLHFKPGGPAKPPAGSIIRVTAHVDDPAAETCSFVYADRQPQVTLPAAIAVAWCRERLVVDRYDVIGTDPAYHD